ncbi:MAG: hypothetical protein WAQ98_23085 [Blastocatellia bacterium]
MENFDLEFNIEEVEEEIFVETDIKITSTSPISRSKRPFCC